MLTQLGNYLPKHSDQHSPLALRGKQTRPSLHPLFKKIQEAYIKKSDKEQSKLRDKENETDVEEEKKTPKYPKTKASSKQPKKAREPILKPILPSTQSPKLMIQTVHIEKGKQIGSTMQISKCKICLQNLRGFDLICPEINCCSSLFHLACLKAYALDCLNNGKFPIKCPQAGCGYDITSIYLNQIVGLEEMCKYLRLITGKELFRNPKHYTQCATRDCDHIFRHLNSHDTSYELTCPNCHKKTCRRCKLGFHTGLSCVEYKHLDAVDVEAYKVFTKENYQKCSNCNYYVEKTEGCNHISCRCGAEFCYKCGLKWKTCKC